MRSRCSARGRRGYGAKRVARMERSAIRGGALVTSSGWLAKFRTLPVCDPTPIRRQNAGPHVAMERRVRPAARAGSKAVFDRIVVNVVDMPAEVRVVPYRVLPKASLPHVVLAAPVASDRQPTADNV